MTTPDQIPTAPASWYQTVEEVASVDLGHGAVLTDLADAGTWEWLREIMTPAEAVAWVLAGDDEDDYFPVTCSICDGVHSVCPIESPDPGYYADEMAAGR